jgi:hypothetical protein
MKAPVAIIKRQALAYLLMQGEERAFIGYLLFQGRS